MARIGISYEQVATVADALVGQGEKPSFSLRTPTAPPGDPGGAVFRKETTQTLACTKNGPSPPPPPTARGRG